ncbi:MAG: M15 family metallopeptidase [Spirochaetes bacterium]|nr:M15 family metallopeptidase [Spirochaetota bacterium]MBU1080192.1 M15 family metallopeptidase [Spirochaetota bacterium]
MNGYGLVRVREACPRVVVDLRYATARNFLGTRLYDGDEAWLLEGAATRLAEASRLAEAMGRRLVVLDAYRPLSVQALMWDLQPDPAFVAPASRGSIHNRGAAVDVALAGPDGRELAMPSAFDEFSERASHGYEGGDPVALENRGALRSCMEAAGFAAYEAEWWHYVDPDSRAAPLLDVPLSELALGAIGTIGPASRAGSSR